MSLRNAAVATAAALVALAIPDGLPAETLKIASPIRGSWEGAIPELGKQAGIFRKHGLDLDIFYTQGAARRCRSSSPDRSTSG